MKGNRRQPAAASQQPPTPASPTTKGTAKYTNKDGSKFITVPKTASSTDQAQPSPTAESMPSPAAPGRSPAAPSPGPAADETAAPVNRKKAKRRAKAAAKAAAEADLHRDIANGLPSPAASGSHGSKPSMPEPDYSDDEHEHYPSQAVHGNGHAAPPAPKSRKKKGKKGGDPAAPSAVPPSRYPAAAHHHSAGGHAPSPLEHSLSRAPGISKEKIWNTSSQEERQRIKEFWLGLGEDERKSLVKVEKDAVLKKMKEQQKHTCSCTVCGRKRTAIEEELEGLYDAYYEELESFANQPNHNGEGPPMLGPSRHFGSTGGYTSQVMPSSYPSQQPSRGRIVEHVGDDEDEEGEEEYSDEELDEEDEYSDEEEPEEIHRDHPTEHQTDFFNFGNSLTVQGGILTVADDLLKNDGKKFIEMMEQLAERRMAREEDAKDQYSRNYPHAVNGGGYPTHTHPPPPEDEEEYEEDEEEEEYDSQEEEYDEEEDTMTEEQRMEEGRRMFQIFAARMFEQRVLTAYREKVARERQEKLLEELAEESREADQRKAKKAKEAQKRKDKLQQKKQALAEEKARKEAERAAEEAQRLAEEKRKVEEQQQKAEERRKKKEAQKKAEEEERLRKEAERQRRLHEVKERQAEQERKAREAKEREKKAKEDAKLKEKAAREQKEREVRERKEKQEKERLERETKAKADKEAREKQRREERAAQKAASLASAPVPITLVKRPSQQPSAAIPALPQNPPAGVASPQIPVATPVLPKIPTPMRPRQPSQQEAANAAFSGTAPASQPAFGLAAAAALNSTPDATTSVDMSPAPMGQLSKGSSSQGASSHSQTASPLSASTRPSGIQQQHALHQQQQQAQQHQPIPLPQTMGFAPPLNLFGGEAAPIQGPPGFAGRMGHENMFAMGGDRYRAPGPPGPPGPPGLGMPITSMNGQPGRGGFGPMPPPGFGQTPELASIGTFGSVPKDSPIGLHSHSRQASSGFDSPAPPIARPAPIGRPGSVAPGQRGSLGGGEADDPGIAPHLGSSALIDDSDVPLQDYNSLPRRGLPPGPRAFPPVAPGPFGMDPTGAFGSPLWSHPSPAHIAGTGGAFGHPAPPPGFGNMGPMPAAMSWGSPLNYPPPGLARPQASRSVQIRLLLCRACQELSEGRSKVSTPDRSGGIKTRTPDLDKDYISLEDIKAQIDLISPADMVTETELLDLCDTEGNQSNGGGSFDTRQDPTGQVQVRWVPNGGDHIAQRAVGRSLGEIGSPVIGAGSGGSNSPWGTPVGGR